MTSGLGARLADQQIDLGELLVELGDLAAEACRQVRRGEVRRGDLSPPAS
jgi:hypothetical protein